jgi:hypothetical protein
MIKQLVLKAILSLKVIIPLIKTFNKNLKLLAISVYIIKRELIDFKSGSLFDSLYKI